MRYTFLVQGEIELKVTVKTFSISLRRLVKYLKVIVHSYEHFLVSLQGLANVH